MAKDGFREVRIIEYMGCPICARPRRYNSYDALPKMFSDEQPLQVRVQKVVGGGPDTRRMEWGKRAMTRAELRAVESLLLEVLERVRDKIEETQ